MRDNHYRSCCFLPNEYDKLIDHIKEHNPYCKDKEDAERFASESVNSCIRAVMWGDVGKFCTTGGCMAVLDSSAGHDNRKVILCYRV